jgi:hypothetical protein
MAKKFKGNKPISDIRAACEAHGWEYEQDGWDKGGDWINFTFKHDQGAFSTNVLFNGFNGTFIIKGENGEMITERSTNLDGVPWYDALLEFIYEPLEDAA